ncbi:MAG: hypothetical protein IJS20_13435, partial [Bacteroidales bacterium]|nr:hypothetical protein [Bacteroidales bacterium]
LPFRTEKLNLATPMVLPTRESRKRPPYKSGYNESCVHSFFNAASNVAQTLGGHLTRGVLTKRTPLFLCEDASNVAQTLGGHLIRRSSHFEDSSFFCMNRPPPDLPEGREER